MLVSTVMDIHLPTANHDVGLPRTRNETASLICLVLLCVVSVSVRGSVVFTNVLSFDGTNGASPDGPLLQVSDGGFFCTMEGPPFNAGSVFYLSSSGLLKTVTWFSQTNGSDPGSSLVQTPDGSIYGTTWLGGFGQSGSLFRVLPNGTLESLQSFNGTNGVGPYNLVLGPDNALYGITRNGGLGYTGQQSGFGTIFRIDTNGVFNTLVAFNGTNGHGPGALILGSDGMFYGVTVGGGALYLDSAPGAMPTGYGTVFRMSLDGGLTTLFSFSGTNGAAAFGITEATDGNLYGVTALGGTSYNPQTFGNGTAFRLTKNGLLSTIVEFPATNHYPYSIIQGADGNFYGGTLNPGSIFQFSPSGALAFVYTFANGAYAVDGLTRAADGTLYGTTGSGGINYYGSIFHLITLPDLPMLQSATQGNGFFNFTWNASLGRSYQVQNAVDLRQFAWTNLGSPILATNAMISFSSTANSGANCLYRVVLLP